MFNSRRRQPASKRMEDRVTSTNIQTYIRERIKVICLIQGLSLKDLSLRANMPVSSLGCLETGRFGYTLRRLEAVLDALGVGIIDVWPLSSAALLGPDASGDAFTSMRFHEVFLLSGAESGCLLVSGRRRENLRVVCAVNCSPRCQMELILRLRSFRSAEHWLFLSRTNLDREAHLALLNARLNSSNDRVIGDFLRLITAQNMPCRLSEQSLSTAKVTPARTLSIDGQFL